MANPWAHSREEGEFDTPDYPPMESNRYAVPDIDEDAPYLDQLGWSPTMRPSPMGFPDDARLGNRMLRDRRPDPNRPPEEFWGRIDADGKRRHSVEDIDADGWTEAKGVAPTDQRWEYNPRLHPPPEPRPTQQLAPKSYNFWRPFMTNTAKVGARSLSGEHFSMADHRRDYEIGGMAPAVSRRNTYRLDPTPWDVDVVDVPPVTEPDVLQARYQAIEVSYGSRNWRL